jgi:hypothetical protein
MGGGDNAVKLGAIDLSATLLTAIKDKVGINQ